MPNTNDRGGFAALDPCVHCGFCLPACPTYLATGDESDSPRGRILLMRALEHGELDAHDPALIEHLDRCLGCRGCEPACPSGVGYGRGLEAAREELARANGLPLTTRLLLSVFRHRWAWRTALFATRGVRGSGLARRLAGPTRLGFSFGMVAATTPRSPKRIQPATHATRQTAPRGTVALFRGCVMDGLFDHVHAATIRTLTVNGYEVVEVPGQTCCGALHDHAGDRDGAQALARVNVRAFAERADHIVINSAGCGALLKDYGHLTDGGTSVGEKVRDVTEILADAGPVPGGELPLDVAYDAPCHLEHAQKVQAAPLALFGAVPALRLRQLPGSNRCCGSAGLYGVLHWELSQAVLADKIAAIRAATPVPAIIATGNPGCLMQIGAGLLAVGLPTTAAHPVEILDWSYQQAGFYR
jgi:glycolate oxidase iron-sulfur subunit